MIAAQRRLPLWGTALAITIAMLSVCTANAANVRVIDGDTLVLNGIHYRLYGIEAPERKDVCQRAQGPWWCGAAATAAVRALVAEGRVKCEPLKRDRYGRTVARCWAGLIEINDELVRRGFAWACRKYSFDYVPAEQEAKRKRRGVWSAPNSPAGLSRKCGTNKRHALKSQP